MPPDRRRRKWLALSLLVVSLLPGCQGTGRRWGGGSASSAGEPALKADVQPGVSVIEPADSAVATASAPSTRMVAAVDRHPLLRKPKEYYESTNSNKAVKVAAATVVGIPAGIVGELKQIVVGTPSATTASAPSSTIY